MTWQLFFNKDPAIGKIIELFDNKTKSHMFARRIGSKGHLIQLSTAYTNGGIRRKCFTNLSYEIMAKQPIGVFS